MEDTNMKQPMQLFFFGIGAVTAMKLITYTASTYGDRILTELGWLLCSIEVKTKKLLNRLRPFYESFFPQNERTEVCIYSLGNKVEELSYLAALEYEPKHNYELVSYTVCSDDGNAYTALYSDIKMLSDKVKLSPKKFLTAMMKKGNVDYEVRPPDGVNPHVIGNILFNPAYMRWTGINVTDNDDYEVLVIDSDVVQKNITWNAYKRQFIKMTADGYEIENIENIENIEKNDATETTENERSGWFGFWTSQSKTDLTKLI